MSAKHYPDALTEFVADDEFVSYRRTIRRNGLVIVMSSPTSGGFYVTTATHRTAVAR